jgi:hypothetical protein
MGNFWENSEVKRDDVKKNLFEINQITKTLLFMKKMEIYLIFELDDDTLSKRNSRKIIKVTIYDYFNNKCFVEKREKPISITIEEFYQYFNTLMNSRFIFLSDQMKNKIKKKGTDNPEDDDDDSDLCPICNANKVDISLPCSHFFCENCIKTWLVKSESCPLCRYKLQVNKKTPSGVEGAQSWDVIEEVDEEQLAKESEQTLRSLTKKLFSDNQNKK